ncbi:MAG TPA: hypothetical protein DDW52_19350 [Planctomycetaceae bacterium]|nr:hypothetical protein [Planctomycetaceae bacterium]
MRLPLQTIGVVVLHCAIAQADTILLEDFEDATVSYTTNEPDQLGLLGANAYHGRVDFQDLPGNLIYNNRQGSGFFGAQDTNSASGGSHTDTITLNWTGIDISNFTDISASWFVAEDTANDTNEDWDIDSSVRLDFQIDGGGFFQFFAIESSSAVSGNTDPKVDTNFDGVGDGTAITDTFTQFNTALPNGSVLDVRLTITFLDQLEEDIAFDSLLVEGTSTAVPEPASLSIFGISAIGMVGFSRRRRV